MYKFRYSGGVRRIAGVSTDAVEHFVLYQIMGGEEISVFGLIKQGIIGVSDNGTLSTDCKFLKVFLKEQDQVSSWASFYLELSKSKSSQIITIVPFRGKGSPPWFLRCKGRFMKRKEYMDILTTGSISYNIAKSMRIPPRQVIQDIITIQRPSNRGKTRKIYH